MVLADYRVLFIWNMSYNFIYLWIGFVEKHVFFMQRLF